MLTEAIDKARQLWKEKYPGWTEMNSDAFKRETLLLKKLSFYVSFNNFPMRGFQASDAREFLFGLFQAVQETIDDYQITKTPRKAVLCVHRPSYKLGVYRMPSRWVPVISLRIQKRSPFVDFEEIELAHQELWTWCRNYMQAPKNPCWKIPLTEQKCGNMLPMT